MPDWHMLSSIDLFSVGGYLFPGGHPGPLLLMCMDDGPTLHRSTLSVVIEPRLRMIQTSPRAGRLTRLAFFGSGVCVLGGFLFGL